VSRSFHRHRFRFASSLLAALPWSITLLLPTESVAAKPSPVDKRVAQIQRAIGAYHSGDYEKARSLLTPLVDKDQIKDYRSRDYLLFVLGDSEALLAVETGTPSLCNSASLHLRAVESVPETPLTMQARARNADCLRLVGKSTEAETAYRSVLASSKSPIDLGTVRFRQAELLGHSDDKQGQEARSLLRKLYIEQPLHPLAESALGKLRELDREAKLDAQEHLDRAKNLLAGRRWVEAVAELQGLPQELGPTLRDEVDYWLGTTFYRMRRNYGGAAQLLLAVAKRLKGDKQADAMFHGARALSRADRDDEAIVGYRELLSIHPHSRYSAEASFLIGWLEYNRSRHQQAIANLEEMLRRYSTGTFAEEARWYIGWSRYLLGDYAGALPAFEHIGKKNGLVGSKGLYWAAVAQLKLGKKSDGLGGLRRLAEREPFSYYGMLSRVRLRDEGQKLPLFLDPARQLPEGLPDWQTPPDKQVLADDKLRRPEELLLFGLKAEAGQELQRVESALIKTYTAGKALPVLFGLYQRAESFRRPHLLAEVHGQAALRKDPHAVPGARPYWESMYPLAYRRLIEQYGPSGDNPPRYLYSIMQKESAYNPYDVSYADAIGLLQMIPPTSRRVAGSIGRTYTDDVLYDPEGNIQFGAWYIGRLLKKFKGQVALGAGSYNAGPRAMTRWLGRQGDRPLDEFVELCPYSQTREYMKKLLGIYAHYVYLWDKEEYLPSLKVDKEFLSTDGIDY
jgi:soluble lytic murein transglycosylase